MSEMGNYRAVKFTHYFVFILWITLLPATGRSQSPFQNDSLKKALLSLQPAGKRLTDDTLRITILCTLGKGKDQYGRFTGNIDTCLHQLQEAEKLATAINWLKGLLLSNLYAGAWYSWKGDNFKGLEKKQRAVYYAEKLNDQYYLGYAYRIMGDCYANLGSHNQAIYYYKKSLIPSRKSNVRNYLIAEENIGLSFLEKKEYNPAKLWLEKCIADCKNDEQLKKYALLYLCEVYLGQKDNPALFATLEKYKKNTFADSSFDVRYYAITSKAYFSNKNYTAALKYAQQGISFSKKSSQENLMLLYEALYQSYEKLGQTSLAFGNYKIYTNLREINTLSLKKNQINLVKYEYENRIQKDKINLLDSIISLQNREKIALLMGAIIFIGFSIVLFKKNKSLQKKSSEIESQRRTLIQLKDQLSENNEQLRSFNNRLEESVKERTKELVEANRELLNKNREIQEAFLNGKVQERKRVASELHDNLGSTLSGLIWQLESLEPEAFTPGEQKVYTKLIGKIREAYEDVRHISHNLMPTELNYGLELALDKLINELNATGKIRVDVIGEYASDKFTKADETELYSIFLEIINNILKHANALTCTIRMETHQTNFIIYIEDNGKGFDVNSKNKRGKGLENIKERIKTLKGNLDIYSTLGKGSSFKLTIPFNHSKQLQE